MSALGILGAIGAIGGGILFSFFSYGSGGFPVGAVLGFLLAWNITLTRAFGKMEIRLLDLVDQLTSQKESQEKAADKSEELQESRSVEPTVMRESNVQQDDDLPVTQLKKVAQPSVPPPTTLAVTSSASPTVSKETTTPSPAAAQPKQSVSPPPQPAPNSIDRLADYIKTFFTQGNVVLRVGLIILFFGIAFLLKYAAEHSVLSIELRLLGVVLAGLAMLVFGWRLRNKRPGFALLVQGGGVGVLFLTVFAAYKLYHLLPMPLSFGIMLGLVCTSTVLALLQDARSLALFGAAGGFLAPVLLSTGSGSHVALFSYYAMLNTGILTVAWFKAWRELNLLGFIFTLGIGSLWGAQGYQPQFFSTTEPFLILFFLMFTMIGVLFAFRQPPQLRGYVDGTLVFGTPIICFSLQAALVKDMEYGMAISALLISLFYVGLATLLWNKGNERLREGMRTLTEAFLALGVVFVTLAVPLALSGSWTAVTWAMEGAALIWVGIRQQRIIPRNFGFLLQIGAAFFFMTSGTFYGERMVIFNGVYLGALIISLSALFSSWYLYQAGNLRRFERFHHLLLFIWGTIWWFSSGINEIDYQVPYKYEEYAYLLFIAASCLTMMALRIRLAWPQAGWPSLGLLPVMAYIALNNIGWHSYFSDHHVFADYGYLVWPLAVAMFYYSLYLARKSLGDRLLKINHVGGFLLLVLLISSETAWQVDSFTGGAGSWSFVAWGLVPMVMVRLLHLRWFNRGWPLSEYGSVYQQFGGAIVLPLVWLWLLAGCVFIRGSAMPLPFITLFNPLELGQLIVLLLIISWALTHRGFITAKIDKSVPLIIGSATVFIWINSVLARAIHQFYGVRFNIDAMMDSQLYQASVSILWGLMSLALMVTAGRRQSRTTWIAGTVLIGATVVKLFLIDLARSGTIERIVSFLAVGILLMVIGYFSPLPPVADSQEEEK